MLTIAHVGKIYANHVRALDGVSLDVAQAEIVAVVGGSGCGKSTLLRLVSGLDNATQGNVTLDGDAIVSPHEKIGIVFQEPRLRSEERRVGKERPQLCRSRWSPYH